MPLEAINAEAAREKSVRQGHPSSLHPWWARRPLAACRAVLFGQLVDDPSSVPEEFPGKEEQEKERERLHALIADLVRWENSTDKEVLNRAKREIARSIARWRSDRDEAETIDEIILSGGSSPQEINTFLAKKSPPVYDPFCGGGSIPLEAQRLGLPTHASDLNPVATLITKALIEIPPHFSGVPPVNPEAQLKSALTNWGGAQGIAEDVRYYGERLRAQAKELIGHLYPPVLITECLARNREDLKPYLGRTLPVIAWLWARTVTCPNPTCQAIMPLAKTFWLSRRPGSSAWVHPIKREKTVHFQVFVQKGQPPSGSVNRRGAVCLCCGNSTSLEYVRQEGRNGRMGQQLVAMVLDGTKGRLYVDPTVDDEGIAHSVKALNIPEESLPERALGFRVQAYGIAHHCDLYTPRQQTTLTTFSELIPDIQREIETDSRAHNRDTAQSCDQAELYAKAVITYLGLALSKLANYNCKGVTWSISRDQAAQAFGRQALPIVWDYAEVSPFAGAAGDLKVSLAGITQSLRKLPSESNPAVVSRADARELNGESNVFTFSTDPPYYDNIGYADLSDFFYVWLRRSLRAAYPDLFEMVLTPKRQELIVTPFREQTSGKTSKESFEDGLRSVFGTIRRAQIGGIPVTIYYAFKQEETDGTETSIASSGWESMLSSLIQTDMSVVATWPVRTEREGRLVGNKTNALASSVVLACRPRPATAPVGTRNEFVAVLRQRLPTALERLQEANIAPVDLAQSAIGPGIAVFSSFAKVLESDGSSMSVRSALGIINQVLDEVLTAEEAEYDSDTRWAITWFTQYGFEPAPYGEAELLSKARTTSVQGLERAGIVEARAGKVRLLKREELEAWAPDTDDRFTIWEACQHLIKTLEFDGETAAARLLKQLDSRAGAARDLAYRLYQHCDRKGDAEEARAYNGLVVAWPRLAALAAEEPRPVAPTLDFS